jgi:hypothetical protein
MGYLSTLRRLLSLLIIDAGVSHFCDLSGHFFSTRDGQAVRSIAIIVINI